MDFFYRISFRYLSRASCHVGSGWKSVFYKLGFIQAAVEWTYSLGNAVLCSCDRRYLYFFVFLVAEGSSLAEDLFSEIIPADEAAFVGCVIVAVFLCLDHVYQKTCKVVGVGRSSDLVTDYGKLVMGFSQIYHGTDKVFAVFAEYPCNTYDKEFIYSAGYCQFTVKLGLTVYVLWSVVLAVRIPWCGSLAVKT